MSAAQTVEEEFDERAEARRADGVIAYRGGDEAAPFVGDAVEYAVEECLDLRNYAIQGGLEGRIPVYLVTAIRTMALGAYACLRYVQRLEEKANRERFRSYDDLELDVVADHLAKRSNVVEIPVSSGSVRED